MLSVTYASIILSVIYKLFCDECHYAECHYDEGRSACKKYFSGFILDSKYFLHTSIKGADSDIHSSLLCRSVNYSHKKFFSALGNFQKRLAYPIGAPQSRLLTSNIRLG
jgi:hypothetical protein